jgi:hypothetical protein
MPIAHWIKMKNIFRTCANFSSIFYGTFYFMFLSAARTLTFANSMAPANMVHVSHFSKYMGNNLDPFYLDKGIILPDLQVNPDSYIIKELIPHIDSTYRTLNEKKSRAITGASEGGYGTFHFAFKYPQLFAAAGPFCSGGPYANGALMVDNYSPAEDPHKLAVTNAAILSTTMRVHISVGSADGLLPYSQEMANICKANNIPYEMVTVPNAGHDLNQLMTGDGLKSVQYITQGFKPVSVKVAPQFSSRAISKAMIALQGSTLNITISNPQVTTIELITFTGHIAETYTTSAKSINLDFLKYAQGSYCVRVRTASGNFEKQIALIH